MYKSTSGASGGLGGAINTSTGLITSGLSNNFFTSLSDTDRLSGKDEFQCFYLKNTGSEDLDNFFFWLAATQTYNKTEIKFARGSAGRNGTEQTIPNINQSPVDVTWRTLTTIPSTPMITNFNAGDIYPIWIWWHIDPVTSSDDKWVVAEDLASFNFKVSVEPSGGGTVGEPPIEGGGGGGGGNPQPTVADFKVAFIGDEGCEPETNDVITLIQNNDYDYVWSVGDHAYASASCWTNRFTVLKPDFNSAYGNHEYSESGGVGPYKTFFGHTLTYFTTKFKNIQFIVMDTNIDIDAGSAQNQKILQWLDEANADGTIDWIIVLNHHPWWVDGSHHPADEFEQIETYHSKFVTKRVDFVISGHNHNAQRTHQLNYNANDPLDSPTITDSTSPYVSGGGLIHVVVGIGGHDSGSGLYDLPTQPSFQAYQSNDYNGLWQIKSTNNGQTLTCSFLDVDDNEYDVFVINK